MGFLDWLRSPTAIQVLTLMVFWGQFQNYMMRVNVYISIVAMASPVEKDESSSNNDSCVITASNDKQDRGGHKKDYDLDWDATTINMVLASFSWGYVCTQMIGGRAAEWFGVKKVYGLCMLGCGILTLLLPLAAKWHSAAFITIR